MNLEYTVYALAFLLVLLFLYSWAREKDNSKKIRVLAKSVGEVSRQLYESEMRLNEKVKQLQELKEGLSSADIETLVDVNVSEKLIQVNQDTARLQQDMHAFGEEFAGRIVRIENNLKEASINRANVGGADDKRILQLYSQGHTVEDIAKELRISTPEVEFSLKLADLR
jgi:cell division protein ZapA (FtsZ GTPase activity inhibitor)